MTISQYKFQVAVNNKNYEVNESIYNQIVSLVNSGRVCEDCKNEPTFENPLVRINHCLNCTMKQLNSSYDYETKKDIQVNNFEYLGNEIEVFNNLLGNGGTYYYFRKLSDNKIHRCNKNYDDLPEYSSTDTLKYYGFSYPMEWGEYRFYGDWSIKGDLTKNEVILITNYASGYVNGSYRMDIKHEFLTFKRLNTYKIFSKRKKYVRDLLKEAGQLIEGMTDNDYWFESNQLNKFLELAKNEPDLY